MLAPVVLDANLGGFVRSGSLHALAAAAGVFVIAALRTRSDRIAGTALVLLVAADLARLLGIDYALLSDHGSDSAQPPGLRTLWSPVPGVRLFGVTHRLPRVFLSFHAARLPATQLQARLLDEDVVAGRETLLEESSPDLPLPAAKAEPVPCTIETYATTRLSARCVADRPAVAVFVEQQLDGWSATVDGGPWERNAVGGCRLSGHRRAGCPLVAVGRRSSRGMGSQVPICGWPRACFVPAWVAGAPSLPPPESSLGSPFYERVTERCRAEQVKSQEGHHADQMLRFPVGRGSRRRQ
jgi:hypothetical protein